MSRQGDTDAKLLAVAPRHVSIASGSALWPNFDSATHRVYDAWELNEHVVAGRLDDATAMVLCGPISSRLIARRAFLVPPIKRVYSATSPARIVSSLRLACCSPAREGPFRLRWTYRFQAVRRARLLLAGQSSRVLYRGFQPLRCRHFPCPERFWLLYAFFSLEWTGFATLTLRAFVFGADGRTSRRPARITQLRRLNSSCEGPTKVR
jgi:hypothetical protein